MSGRKNRRDRGDRNDRDRGDDSDEGRGSRHGGGRARDDATPREVDEVRANTMLHRAVRSDRGRAHECAHWNDCAP